MSSTDTALNWNMNVFFLATAYVLFQSLAAIFPSASAEGENWSE